MPVTVGGLQHSFRVRVSPCTGSSPVLTLENISIHFHYAIEISLGNGSFLDAPLTKMKLALTISRGISRDFKRDYTKNLQISTFATDSVVQNIAERENLPWEIKGVRVPRKYWSQHQNRRKYFEWLHKTLGLVSMDDWYSVKMSQVRKHSRGPMYMFDDGLYDALSDAYPEHTFHPWRFSYVPHTFWNSQSNKRQFMDWVGKQLEIKQMKDWYSVSIDQMRKLRADRVMANHGDSLSATLRAVYPEHEWQEWLFDSRTTSLEFLKSSLENQRRYVKWLEEMLHIQTLEGWYQIEQATILSGRLKGSGWLDLYQGSLCRALESIYPSHEWLPWKFQSGVQDGFWDVPANRHRFVDWVSRELDLKHKEDWYRVRLGDIKRIGAWGVVSGNKSWIDVVTAAYPDHSWDLQRFG